MYTERIIENEADWKNNGFSYCTNEDPWQHDFEKSNYRTVDTGFADFIRKHAFIKLAKTYPLKNWEESIKLIKEDYSLTIKLLTSQASHLTKG